MGKGTPLLSKPSLSLLVVSPAYEEWSNLAVLRAPMLEVLSGYHPESRWVVVCEPSPAATLKQNFELHDKIIAVDRPADRTDFGYALQLGIDQISSSDDFVIFIDADGSHDPSQIPEMVDHFTRTSELDVVISSRYIHGGSSDNSRQLLLMSRMLNWAFSLALGLKLNDCSNNFKAYRAGLLRGAVLSARTFEAVEELLVLATERKRSKLKILEVPGHFSRRQAGRSKRSLVQFIGMYLVSFLSYARRIRKFTG